MTAKQDILQEIPLEKLPELKIIYKQNWPYTIHAYYMVETIIQYYKLNPNQQYMKIYCPNGDFTDGTILIIIEMYCYDVFIFTMDKALVRLENVLRETKLIDWSKEPLFCAMHEDFYEMVFKVRNEIGHPFPNDVPSHVWWLPKEKAIQYDFTIPDELYVNQLNETHIDTINSLWPHRSPGSEKYLGKLIELNGGIGLFSNSDNELCAWVLKNYFGSLGVLQVADKHKRKGYGTLITKVYSKILAERDGYDIFGFIVRNNSASQNMFGKLGFTKIIPITWLENSK